MRIPVCIALLTASLSVAAADTPLLPAGELDQTAVRVVTLPAPTAPVEREPVRFSWALDPQEEPGEPQPFVAESREYWQTVEGTRLRRGVEVTTTAPGAIIKLSPARGAAAVEPDAIRVSAGGRPVPLEHRTGSAQLRAAGMPIGRGAAVARLGAAAGPGRYAVRLPQARGRYVLHVYEPGSDVVLFASVGRERVLAGGRTSVVVNLQRGDVRLRGLQAGGLLVSPAGRSWPLALHPGRDGLLRGTVSIPTDAGSAPGLWEVQVFAGDGTVQRDARTAFAVAQPTARLAGGYDFDATVLSFDLPLLVGSPGRYEARGTLYATAPGGLLQPVSIAHSADWLTPGKSRLTLAFDREHLPAGYGAPFELRDLELNDQSRMAPLERRARAARVGR